MCGDGSPFPRHLREHAPFTQPMTTDGERTMPNQAGPGCQVRTVPGERRCSPDARHHGVRANDGVCRIRCWVIESWAHSRDGVGSVNTCTTFSVHDPLPLFHICFGSGASSTSDIPDGNSTVRATCDRFEGQPRPVGRCCLPARRTPPQCRRSPSRKGVLSVTTRIRHLSPGRSLATS